MDNVGKYMFGVGALLQYEDSDEILLLRRSSTHSDFNQDKWELAFGRKAQFESIVDGLDREIAEELGKVEYKIVKALRLWHFYRGNRSAGNEIIGITFWCRTTQRDFELSAEHSEARWVPASQALNLVTVPGILEDIGAFVARDKDSGLLLSTNDGNLFKV